MENKTITQTNSQTLTNGQAPTDNQTLTNSQAPTGGQVAADSQAPTGGQVAADSQVPTNSQAQTNSQTQTNGQNPADGQTQTNRQVPTDRQIPTNGQTPNGGQAPNGSQVPTNSQSPVCSLILTPDLISGFARDLEMKHRSIFTREKYLHDVKKFVEFLAGRVVSSELVLAFREALIKAGYALSSVGTMLATVSVLLKFLGKSDCRVERPRVQKPTFRPDEKELTKDEYFKLLKVAEPRERVLMEAMCSTGIRVSELQYFTVESVRSGSIDVTCKGKTRSILLSDRTLNLLLSYIEKTGLTSGLLFFGRNGQPIHRGTVWSMMKRLARKAEIPESKSFPHNLRKLFARMFYEREHDIAKLADVLGHSSIDTTRIYIMTTGSEHRAILDRLDLVPDTDYCPTEKGKKRRSA